MHYQYFVYLFILLLLIARSNHMYAWSKLYHLFIECAQFMKVKMRI
jgi:hypothetical protein